MDFRFLSFRASRHWNGVDAAGLPCGCSRFALGVVKWRYIAVTMPC